MTLNEFNDLLQQIRSIDATWHERNVSGPQQAGVVELVENALGVTLSQDYAQFLIDHGSIVYRVSGVTGEVDCTSHGSVVGDTIRMREPYSDAPRLGVVLHNNEDVNYVVVLEGDIVNIYYPFWDARRLGGVRESFDSFGDYAASVLRDEIDLMSEC